MNTVKENKPAEILVNEGFGSMANYEDAYWVKREFVEAV